MPQMSVLPSRPLAVKTSGDRQVVFASSLMSPFSDAVDEDTSHGREGQRQSNGAQASRLPVSDSRSRDASETFALQSSLTDPGVIPFPFKYASIVRMKVHNLSRDDSGDHTSAKSITVKGRVSTL